MPPALPLVGVVGTGLVLWAGRHGTRTLALLAALSLVGSLLVVHPVRSFRDGAPDTLEGPIAAGPMAGLHATPFHVQRDDALRALVDTWVEPGDGVFFYGIPGGYVYSQAPMQTNLVWVSAFGQANAQTVRWWQETGRYPDVAVVAKTSARTAGSWDALVATDPVLTFLQDRYDLVADLGRDEGDAYVFRATASSLSTSSLTGAAGSAAGR